MQHGIHCRGGDNDAQYLTLCGSILGPALGQTHKEGVVLKKEKRELEREVHILATVTPPHIWSDLSIKIDCHIDRSGKFKKSMFDGQLEMAGGGRGSTSTQRSHVGMFQT